MTGSMSRERWKMLEPLLDEALDLDPQARPDFLQRTCGSDAALRDELERLIDACDRGEELLASPATATYAPLIAGAARALPEALGRYRLVRELGRGGMATVFLADDPKHARQVAVKVLHGEVVRVVGRERFLREIEIAARLSHPHILPVHDSVDLAPSGTSGDNPDALYYVTPYVAGESLRDRLRREGPVGPEEAARLAGEIADALDYAHRQGVIHCDVKPENILLHEGHAVVADFGIARAVSSTAADDRRSVASLAFGTPAYMSPEQAAGRTDVDGRSDVYSLGCVLHEMLTGERPVGRAASRASAVSDGNDQVRRSVPAALAQVIQRATAEAPGDRYASAADMAGALRAGRPNLRPGRRAVAVASALGVAGAAIFVAARAGTRAELDPNLLAVAPFVVTDSSLTLWREGLVDVLSRNLDGAGPLRTVPPTVVVRRWAGRTDPTTARHLGERSGARLVIYGSLLPGGDSVRASVTLLDARTGNPIVEIERRDDRERIDRIADSLTVAVLRELGRSRRIEAARASFSPTTSLPALKEYLQGEQHYRRAQWDSAMAHFEKALAFDSAFAMVYHRLSRIREWRDAEEFGAPAISELQQRAVRFRRGLAPRDSLLVHIDSLRGAVDIALRERVRTRDPAAHEALVRRLLGALADAVVRYPQDPELWHLYATVRHLHEQWVSLGEVDERQLLETYDRAIALDSTFAPAYVAPVYIAAHVDGASAARRYIAGYLATRPTGPHAATIRVADALFDPPRASTMNLSHLVDTLPTDRACTLAVLLTRIPDSAELSVRLFRRALAQRGSECAAYAAATALAFRGHLREAGRFAGPRTRGMSVMLLREQARFGLISRDSARSELARLRALAPRTMSTTAYEWWAGDRDTASIKTYIAHYDSLSLATSGAYAAMLAGSARSGHAYLALARGDTAEAARRLLAVPDSLQLCWHYGRLTLAQLLIATRRFDEAARSLERRWAGTATCGTPVDDVLWTLLRAQVFERVGRRAEALANYTFVADAWRNADPELQSFVREARAGVARLRSEARPGT